MVLIISMVGIVLSATNIYFFSEKLGFAEYFESKFDIKKYHQSIDKYGFWVVLLWSFFPLVPTDAICYAAGTIRMNFWSYLTAVFIGELVIVSLIIFQI
jgi:uncharacterized membrane protein YdjX (TVP38/TMEM64 family)